MSIINDLLYSLMSTKPKDAAFVFDDTRYGFDRGLWKKIQLLGNIFVFDDVRRGFDKGVWTKIENTDAGVKLNPNTLR